MPKISLRLLVRFIDSFKCHCLLTFSLTVRFRIRIESRRESSFWRKVLETLVFFSKSLFSEGEHEMLVLSLGS